LREQADEIAAKQVDGKFVAEDGSAPGGNEEVSDLLKLVMAWSDIVLER